MDINNAHAAFVAMPDSQRERLYAPDDGIWTGDIKAIWPSLMTAAVILAGRLHECHYLEDLEDAVRMFNEYMEDGTISHVEWQHSTMDVSGRVAAYCMALESGSLN